MTLLQSLNKGMTREVYELLLLFLTISINQGLLIEDICKCCLGFQDTMMMGADYYQTESEIASLLAEGKVPVGVGQNTKIK